MRIPAVAAALLVVLAVPAAATHKKPITQTYDVTAPVPYAVDGSSHCADAPETLSRDTRTVKLPDRGVLEVELSGFLGDWVLELFDAKGRMLGQAARLDPLDTNPSRKVVYKKGAPGQEVRVAVCNVTGGPNAKVRYTFTYR